MALYVYKMGFAFGFSLLSFLARSFGGEDVGLSRYVTNPYESSYDLSTLIFKRLFSSLDPVMLELSAPMSPLSTDAMVLGRTS